MFRIFEELVICESGRIPDVGSAHEILARDAERDAGVSQTIRGSNAVRIRVREEIAIAHIGAVCACNCRHLRVQYQLRKPLLSATLVDEVERIRFNLCLGRKGRAGRIVTIAGKQHEHETNEWNQAENRMQFVSTSG